MHPYMGMKYMDTPVLTQVGELAGASETEHWQALGVGPQRKLKS